MNPDNQHSSCIVVGAGSAGAAVAARLSEDASRSVLLLEAGPDWTSAQCPPTLRNPSNMYKWDVTTYGSVPDAYQWTGQQAKRIEGRVEAPYLRGHALGGCSSVNGCYAIRPPMEEFDDWADSGVKGWGSQDVLPYFVELECDEDFSSAGYHGDSGPTPITRVQRSDWGTIDEGLYSGGLAMGHSWNPDHNAPGHLGVSLTASNLRDGLRVTTNDSYLEPARSRENLTILGHTLVDRVLLSNGRASGVVARVNGVERVFRADQVVLSGGALMTPAILQRSGVGPARLLRALGIGVVLDLPVGIGLQDHAGFELLLRAPGASPARSGRRRGNCTIRFSSGLAGSGFGDLLVTDVNAAPGTEDGALLCKLAQTYSRGSVEITSADPSVTPRADFNLLSDGRDVERALYALRHVFQLVQEASLPRNTQFVDVDGSAVDRTLDDRDLEAWARTVIRDTAHAASGCALGADNDPNAVLDLRCKVRETDNLFVADLSVVPVIPRANTHLTGVMIGERVADWVAEAA